MEQIIERIKVAGESGRTIEVLRIRHTATDSTPAGKRLRIGAERYELPDGSAVQALGWSEFIVARTGELLNRR